MGGRGKDISKRGGGRKELAAGEFAGINLGGERCDLSLADGLLSRKLIADGLQFGARLRLKVRELCRLMVELPNKIGGNVVKGPLQNSEAAVIGVDQLLEP